MIETYYINIEGITEETIKEFIKICENKNLFYDSDYNPNLFLEDNRTEDEKEDFKE